MLRTQILLSEEQRRLLDVASVRTGKSMAELVRDAIDATYLSEQGTLADVAAIERAAGGWSKRPVHDVVDGATYADRLRSGRRLSRTESAVER